MYANSPWKGNCCRPKQQNLQQAIYPLVHPFVNDYSQPLLVSVPGPKFEQLMSQLRQELDSSPPLPGAYSPQVGQLCAAKFALDSQWYRAKVERVSSREKVSIFFIDFGNVSMNKCGCLEDAIVH